MYITRAATALGNKLQKRLGALRLHANAFGIRKLQTKRRGVVEGKLEQWAKQQESCIAASPQPLSMRFFEEIYKITKCLISRI